MMSVTRVPGIFDSFSIYFNGLVPYCICDRDNRLPAGDIKLQSIKEVWQGSYRKWQETQLLGRFDELPEFCPACRDWQSKPLKGTLETMFKKGLTFNDCEMEPPHEPVDF